MSLHCRRRLQRSFTNGDASQRRESMAPASPAAIWGSSPDQSSQFTFRHLNQLAAASTSSPLRIVAHIDLDAFYAQCEMRRLNVADDQPLAVQQWSVSSLCLYLETTARTNLTRTRQGLIAINYPARKFGITRMMTVDEAKKKCPDLTAQHVATWREGDTKWAYHDDAAANIGTHKVSLDPYRFESKKILAVFKENLPADMQRIEKAGIDEVFVDLSAQVHAILLQRYPNLAAAGNPSERLPRPPFVSVTDWQADNLVALDADDEGLVDDAGPEGLVADWDDVAMLIGSEIVRDLREEVWQRLHYTCSAGIARNKMLSKLGSGHKKPNGQTVIRNRAVRHFLSGIKLTKIRNLGGKLGDRVASVFETESISDMLQVPLEQLKTRLGDETGIWLYGTVRGVDESEVSSRTQIKSMLSAKSFRPSITTPEQANKWLRIFVADIFSRLVDEGFIEQRRRPKTMNLHYRHGGVSRSRQSPIPPGKHLDEELLFEQARSLLQQILVEENIWPCFNLSLSMTGFENAIMGNKGIDGFLLKGDEAVAAAHASRTNERYTETLPHHANKKQRTDDGQRPGGIQRFFVSRPGSEDPQPAKSRSDGQTPTSLSHNSTTPDPDEGLPSESPEKDLGQEPPLAPATLRQNAITSYFCPRCEVGFEIQEDLQEHEDWHMAQDLDKEERGGLALAHRTSDATTSQPRGASTGRSGLSGRGGRGRKPGRGSQRLELGQSRLRFGG